MKLRFSSRHFVVAIFALLAANAYAYDFKSDGIYYNVSSEKNRTVEVTSGGYRTYRGNIVIPDRVLNDGRTYTVTSIGSYAFSRCDALTSVEFPASLTTIGSYAFSDCAALTSVDLSSTSLTSIDYRAFERCAALTSLKLPVSLTSIGHAAFNDCASLSVLTVDENNPVFTSRDNVLYSKDLDTLVCYPTGTDTVVVIPDGVRSIRADAFPSKVSAVYCQPQTPPEAVGYYLDMFLIETRMNAVLYVPIGMKAVYMQVYPWRGFKNIEESDFSTVGINGVTAQSEPIVTVRGGKIVLEGAPTTSVIEVFSADGRCAYRGTGTVIEGLPQGAYVVRVGKFSQKLVL